MPSLFITGANRGIGLEFVRQYAEVDWTVHATCRDLDKAQELKALSGNIHLHELDVKNIPGIYQLAEKLDQPFDVVIANAGVGGRKPDNTPQEFGNLDYDSWMETLQINTLGATATAEAFLPHLIRGDNKKLACISSQMGSIADTSAGSIAYRTSKAALNMAMQASAQPLKQKGITTIVFHPGWVLTDMGGPNAKIDVETSVTGMRKILEDSKPSDHAQFLTYDGKMLPW